MSAEANETNDTPVDEFAEAGRLLTEAVFPIPKEEPEEGEEPEKPEAKEEPEKPEEEKPDEEEEKDEEKPSYLMKMARQKHKSAERKLQEAEEYAEKVKQAAHVIKQKEEMFTGIVTSLGNDIVKGFDEICRVAGIDPKVGWETLARAKVNGTPGKVEKQELPEIAALKAQIDELKTLLHEDKQTKQQQSVQQAKQYDHVESINYLLEANKGDEPTYKYAAMLDSDELNTQVRMCINRAYSEPELMKTITRADIARAVDRYAKAQYDKWVAHSSAGSSNPAGPPAKAPSIGNRKPTLSNSDSSSTGKLREKTEAEAEAEVGAMLLDALGL